jgi:predicted DNA-binding transcriptional regulator YafY
LLVADTPAPPSAVDLALVRQAIRLERKVILRYLDLHGVESIRTVWPFALGYFDHVRMLAAWCELRQDFRHFRADRIVAMDILSERYPQRRQVLLKSWREQNGIAADIN